jgi:hypothetical protein
MRPPCKGCEDRTADPNCHMTCKRYCEYRAWKDERNAEKFATCGSVWASETKQKSARKALNRYKREH